jgi:pyruvate dehydrogenase E1 component alpha subunit
MYAASKEAVERARAGEGPTLLECMTFRFEGHVYGDADAYMNKTQKRDAIAADPYPRYRAYLIAEGIADEDQLVAIEKDIDVQLDEAVAFALESPFPDLKELELDVYGEVA